jgi:hypothetical protein
VPEPTRWPEGPLYPEWVGAERWRGWVLYKLKSADWYIDRLAEVGGRLGFGRFVGVEMALDGALAALCGAFDASVGAVIQAVEEFQKQAARDGRGPQIDPVPEHRYSWRTIGRYPGAREKLGVAAEVGSDTTDLVRAVDEALIEKPDELGWLKTLQRLRNAAIHNNTLARHIDVGVEDEPIWSITVNGQPQHPVRYLRATREAVELHVTPMLDVCDHVARHGIPTSRGIQSVTVHGATAVATVSAEQMERLRAAMTSGPDES